MDDATGRESEGFIYLDNHATTRCDPRVVAEIERLLLDGYGNAGSRTHRLGHEAQDEVEKSRACIASALGCASTEIIFTSGATESNNLAFRGLAEHPRRNKHHIVTVETEHRAVLDPLRRLESAGMQVTYLPVRSQDDLEAGRVDLQQLASTLDQNTLLVSVMLANNEVGVIQQVDKIGRLCHERNVFFHCDATQALGRLPIDVEAMHIDMLSFSAHKFHGPKGVGGLYVRRRGRSPRLAPLIDGGGQEFGLRSGTLNVPGIVGMAKALELSLEELPVEPLRIAALRNRLYRGLVQNVPHAELNGPSLDIPGLRLSNNLNIAFHGVSGEVLMLELPELALSSGSACSSANPEPSHVLRALGLDEDRVRSSLRFGLSRFNTELEIDRAIERIGDVCRRQKSLSG
jgi:cysteine desulfurase